MDKSLGTIYYNTVTNEKMLYVDYESRWMQSRACLDIYRQSVDGEELYILSGELLNAPEEFTTIPKLIYWLECEFPHSGIDVLLTYQVEDGTEEQQVEWLKEITHYIWVVDDNDNCITMIHTKGRELNTTNFY